VHVCQRWRYLIFESPTRLNLQLSFSEISPVVELLDVWPPFPFVIGFCLDSPDDHGHSIDKLFAALEHHDRVREIHITSPMGFLWEEIAMAIEESEPFPELRSLMLDSDDSRIPLPATFLNVYAPRLQDLALHSISFPSLPRFLSSTSDLTSLHLYDIPDSGYIPPETMARCLSALPKLESLSMAFEPSRPHFARPHPQQNNPPVPPPIRSVLPALTFLGISAVTGYLEVLAARIDTPVLNRFQITFFYQPDDDILFRLFPENELAFDIPQTARFFGHLEWFGPSRATLTLTFHMPSSTSFLLSSCEISYSASPHSGSWNIHCSRLDRQVIAVTQICSQISPFFSSVQSLIIEYGENGEKKWSFRDEDDMDPTLWLQLFHSFPSIQCLTIPGKLEPSIAAALQGLTRESAAEVFPSLHNLSIIGKTSDEAAQQGIESFIIARQQSSHPIALSLQVKTPE
jgi:hypothetical protein